MIRTPPLARHPIRALCGVVSLASAALAGCPMQTAVFRDTFDVNKASLSPTGGNAYFSLTPGTQRRYVEGDVTLTITVLDETRLVDGVTTRVIEEREEAPAGLIEISRNFFAADA